MNNSWLDSRNATLDAEHWAIANCIESAGAQVVDGQRQRSITWIVVICLLLSMLAFRNYANAFTDACLHEGTFLIVEQHGSAAMVVPSSLAAVAVPLDPDLIRLSASVQQSLDGLGRKQWHVVRTADERGLRIDVRNTGDGSLIFDRSFNRRIELSASAVSPSNRFTIHLQANNVASEMTIFDARDGVTQLVTIPHDADLSAYALGIVFGPDEQCAAISMERAGSDGAETWFVDLEPGRQSLLPLPDIFALDWV